MSVTITGPHYLVEPTLPGGAANPFIELRNYLSFRAIGKDNQLNSDVVNGVVTINGITDIDALQLSTVAALVSAGAEVQGYPVWVALSEEAAAAAVPAYLPNRLDAEGQPLTWHNWHDASHECQEIGGVHYVPGNAFGSELPGSIIAQLIAGGFTLKTLAEMREIVTEAAPE